uniref:Uncharacterized protein n=1 Tax=Anguilla anguilla TaxID=7936 RepID=A0A0E9WAV0_ANGAN
MFLMPFWLSRGGCFLVLDHKPLNALMTTPASQWWLSETLYKYLKHPSVTHKNSFGRSKKKLRKMNNPLKPVFYSERMGPSTEMYINTLYRFVTLSFLFLKRIAILHWF